MVLLVVCPFIVLKQVKLIEVTVYIIRNLWTSSSVVPEQVKLIEVTVYIIRSSWTANRGRASSEDVVGSIPIFKGVETPSVVSRE
jgi:hypothetical protein